MADPATSIVSPSAEQAPSLPLVKVTTTAAVDDFDYIFRAPNGIRAMSLQGDGTFGSGTLSLQGSNDGATFAELPTAVSLTVNGIKSVAVADLGYAYYRIHFAGSTNPTVTAIVAMNLAF